jgi:tetratricopeptide (TPR) repeat protein
MKTLRMTELTIDQALRQGIEAHKVGQVQEADRLYTAILKAQPKHPDANHNLGILAISVGKIEEALPFFKTALEANPNTGQFWLSYIDTLIKLDKLVDAKAVFDQAKSKGAKGDGFDMLEQRLQGLASHSFGKVSKAQNPPQDQLQSFINLYSQGQLQQALKQAETLVQQFPKSAILFNIQGAVLKGLGQLDASVEAYNKALAIKPDHAEAHNNMGVTLKDQGKLEEAIEAYSKALAIKPDYADAYNNMGVTLKDQGKLEEAIEAYSKALAIKPDYADAYNNMGNALRDQGKLEEAIEAYSKALAIKPDYADAYNNMGVVLKDQGKPEEAIKAYSKALAIKPDYAEACNNMGLTLQDQGKLEEAIEAYNKSLAIKPDYAEAYSNMGITLRDQGKLEEAIDAYGKALEIKPDYAEAYYNMGITLKDQGKLEEAIEAYSKALGIKPDYADAYNNMGVTLKDQGKLEEAIANYKKAIEIKPNFAEAVQNLVKFPYGVLNVDCVNIANNFLENFSDKIKNDSKLDFLEANYLMHSNRLDLAFDKFVQANNKKLISSSKLEAMNTNHSTFEKKLKKWRLELAPKDSNKITKIFILAPPRSGKSQLETLLSKSQLVKPLSDAIKLQKNFERITFEQLFVLDETRLCQQGFHAITTTNPHSIFKAMDIARQLPNAFFIFINRDKYDVASEIFRTDWITGHEFAYDPINIFRLIELYKNASDAFLEKLPKNSISISFEEILYQPNDALHQIEERISIQFDLKHLDFTKSKIPLRSVFRKHFHDKFSHLEILNGSINQV